MTGREADPDSDNRPQLRLVSSTGPDPLPNPEPNPVLSNGLEAGSFDDESLEFLLGEELESTADLDFLLVPLLTEAERQMRSIRRAIDAEMWASELLGMLELGAPEDSTPQEREAVTLNLAARLAEYAVDQNSPSGLAILRTLCVIGPQESRARAGEAAARMAESGFRDRAWVPALGRPETRRSWRFRDAEGHQESLTVVFRYGKREHTLTVLIDHELGGGVKDCWIGEDPEGVLTETRAVLAPEGIEVEVIPIDQATLTLRTALTRPECPETPDEIEDIAMCRALLQARVELLVSELPPTVSLRST